MNNRGPIRVLVAGIGGASLGTELCKALKLAGGYSIYGCDISPHAYGHSLSWAETFVVDREDYVTSVLDVCCQRAIRWIVPGGEQPMVLLDAAINRLHDAGVTLVANRPEVIQTCADKLVCVERLVALGFRTPHTVTVETPDNLSEMSYPCVVKPATDSGGSAFVFLAGDRAEAELYIHHMKANKRKAIVQEYLPLEGGGEFTVGVLSLPDARVVSSVAMRRIFHTKLSVHMRTEFGLISSGYSQGLIDSFPEVCATAVEISQALGSTGPLNVQGRVVGGTLVPFEINPRFSASTYLRALAGVNEVDIMLRHLAHNDEAQAQDVTPGYYLRSFEETCVPLAKVTP